MTTYTPTAALAALKAPSTMEINITTFWQTLTPSALPRISGSIAEHGADAAAYTWANACRAGHEHIALSPVECAALCKYLRTFGAWDDAEIAAFTQQELQGLLAQLVAGDAREAGLSADSTAEDWARYEADDNIRGSLFRADDGTVYYTIG